MRTLDRVQRVFAAFVGLFVSWRMLYSTFTDPNPNLHAPAVIVFRVAIIGLILFAFVRRAAGRKLDSIAWGAFAMVFTEGIWKATTMRGSIASFVAVGLAIVGGLIERRLEHAAHTAVAADSASRPTERPHR